MNNNQLKIEQGTISFWIKENAIDFNDGQVTRIFQLDPDGGSILCVKDDDNMLKLLFVVLGKGRADIEYDVSGLETDKRHMIAFTWSLESREITLFLDGKKVASQTIAF
jgi:hypothetical protein